MINESLRDYLMNVLRLEYTYMKYDDVLDDLERLMVEVDEKRQALFDVDLSVDTDVPVRRRSSLYDKHFSFLDKLSNSVICAVASFVVTVVILYCLSALSNVYFSDFLPLLVIVPFFIFNYCFIQYTNLNKVYKREYLQEEKEFEQKYEADLANYREELKKGENLYQNRLNARMMINNRMLALSELLDRKRKKLMNEQDNISADLDRVYAEGIVHESYQNVDDVSYLFHYIDTGRCFELTGPHGAYNLLATERYRENVESGLRDISSELRHLESRLSVSYSSLSDRINNIELSNQEFHNKFARLSTDMQQHLDNLSYNMLSYSSELDKLDDILEKM